MIMAKYKNYVGVTETGDPGIYWRDMKPLHQSNVIITKHLENLEFRRWLLDNSSKIILHATITGWGGTKIEPGVPDYIYSIYCIENLIYQGGFPLSHLVLRVDPLIPTQAGFIYALNVIDLYYRTLFNCTNNDDKLRVRISILDMYKHISKIRKELPELNTLYDGFKPKDNTIADVNGFIRQCKINYPRMEFESCAEPGLTNCEQIGCVSQKDIDILGLTDKVKLVGKSHQRSTCLCPDNKIQLLGGYKSIKKCPSNCKYCYLKHNG